MSKGRRVPPAPTKPDIDYERLGDALCAAFEKTSPGSLGFCLPMAIVGMLWFRERGVTAGVNVGDLDIVVAPQRRWGFIHEHPGDRLMNGDFHAWLTLDTPLCVIDPSARYIKTAVLATPGNRWERADLPRTWIGGYTEMHRDRLFYRADKELTRRALAASVDKYEQRKGLRTLMELVSLHYNNPGIEIEVYDIGQPAA